jgi:NAD(P)-dependent dehydrogenase (short-subunit alcohol dehydrogenase family)
VSAERPLAGRVALVTGAGHGIGRATAERLGRDGASVVVNDVDADLAEAAAGELAELGIAAMAGPADVTDERGVGEVVARAAERFGPVTILVNNAGGAPPGAMWANATADTGGDSEAVDAASAPQWASVLDTPVAQFEAFLRLNLVSAYICSRAVLPGMLDVGWGRIVCVSSIVADTGQRNGAGYAVGKAGLHTLVASLAKEVGPQGIGVNGIVVCNAPHPVRTPDRQAVLDAATHLGRVGGYEEFAAAIAFLAGPDSSYLSGTMVPVDGGTHRNAMF